jgi:YYY domain-containing protein
VRLNRERARRALVAVLVVGGLLRFVGLQWDEGHHLHPDERFISMVEEKLAFPGSAAEYLDSARSPLNPYNRGHDSFVYGTLPLFLSKAVATAVGKTGYGWSYLTGRALSGVADLFTVWLAYLLVRRLGGRRSAALCAGALYAFSPLAIQLSHFWTVETFLTAFSTLTLLGAVRIARGRSSLLEEIGLGIALGLAVACKVTALALLLPVGLAFLVRLLKARENSEAIPFRRRLLRGTAGLALAAAAAAITVRLALPYAFLGPGLLSFRLDPRYVADLNRLAQLSSSVAGFPPALQWAGRTITFPLRNFVFWGAGPVFGVSALVGLAWTLFALRRRINWPFAPLAAHALFLVIYHGTALVKSMRYFLPAYPALAVLTALALSAFAVRYGSLRGTRGWLARYAPAVIVGGTLLCAVAFTSIYRRPHPRVEAARWIYANAPAGARFAHETWDDALPLSLPNYNVSDYAGPALELWGPDSSDKVNHIVQTLAEADWIAVTSNRVYANITRLPAVFPMTTTYYRALFGGRLGFDRAAEFTSYPSLGPLQFADDRAEEQFTVYDHPRVLLFRKTSDFSADRARKILLAALPQTPLTIYDWEKLPRSRRPVGSSLIPARRTDLEKETRAALPSLGLGSVGAGLLWYAALAAIGIIGLPLAWILFPRLEDRGAGVARVLALLLAAFLHVFAVHAGLVENGRRAAFLGLLLVAAAAAFVAVRRGGELRLFLRERWRLIAAGEAAFAAGFLVFLGIRALNPEIYWGEKPMDFSILNILVRTRTLPPSDPWFAGVPLGYYAFGQQIIAFLTLLTGLSTAFTFNLAFGLLGGAIAQTSFTLARNWTGSWKGGLAGAGLTVLLGNLSGLREWLINHRPLDWHYFWATSRVIKDTINEYPLWSLVFADLHAHVIAIPLFLVVATAALHFVRVHSGEPATAVRRVVAGMTLGFAGAAQALTNAWDVPMLAAVLGLSFVAAAASAPGRITTLSLGHALGSTAAAAATALLVAIPLWIEGGGRPGFGRNTDGAAGVDVLTVFGLFFLLAFAWLLRRTSERMDASGVDRTTRLVSVLALAVILGVIGFLSADLLCVAGVLFALAAAYDREASGEDRLALGLLALGFLLVLFPQRFYVADRMNTFFKLYLEAWLVFAVATTALVFRSPARPATFPRWPWVLRAFAVVLAVAALFTSVTAVLGAVRNHFAPYSGPSLDGLRYLTESRPGEARAVAWLRRSLRGTPVLLEAQGASYQDFSRISMLTGLPTVLGWEHHVKQRGNPESEITVRREAVQQIYNARDASRIESLLRRYHIGYVYVGWLERQTYPGEGLKKFDRDKGLFELAYENDEVRIFRVVGGDSEDVLAPAREALPPTAPGQEVIETEEPPSILDAAEGGEPWRSMREPRDAAVDGRGRVWVADFGNSRLRIFDAEGGYLGGWGGRGNGTYQLREPCAVAVRGENLYVADTWNGRVQSYSLAGEWKTTAAGLYGPRGVAVAPDGRVWVTDTGNHQVIVYDASLSQPQPIGKLGKGRGEFMSPVGIAVGSSGSIYVADVGNQRVQVLDGSGSWQRDIPIPWTGTAIEPHVEISGDGTLYVTDPEGAQVLEFDRSGNVSRRWTEDSSGQKFSRPTGLALSGESDTLYVVNSGTSRVSKLKLR